jgi:hypothetical protein
MKITKEKNKIGKREEKERREKGKTEQRREMKSNLLSFFLIYTFFISSLEAYKIS